MSMSLWREHFLYEHNQDIYESNIKDKLLISSQLITAEEILLIRALFLNVQGNNFYKC